MTRVSAERTHAVRGYIRGETEKAILIALNKINEDEVTEDDARTTWFPLSQVISITRAAPGSSELDVLVVKEWILKQKDLI